MHKPEALEALRAKVGEELAVLERITADARDEATNPESRPENKYDTRALEASYLAAGQGERLLEVRQLLAWLSVEPPPCRTGQPGALVEAAIDDTVRWLFLGPRGGPTVTVRGHELSLISIASPLGRALQGLAEGDDAEVERPRGSVSIEVLSLQ